MEKIEQIKAEIKRKYKSYEKILNENINPFLSFSLVSRIEECKSVLSFIDSLEKPVSEDLEQAAVEAFKKIVDDGDNSFLNIFKAGDQWRREKMMKDAVEAVIHPYDGEICVDKDLLSIYDDCQRVKLIIIKEE